METGHAATAIPDLAVKRHRVEENAVPSMMRRADPEQAVPPDQFRAFSRAPLEHADLMTQSQILHSECGLRTEDGGQGGEE